MPLVTRTGQVSLAPKGDKGDKGARMRMRVWGASVSYLLLAAGVLTLLFLPLFRQMRRL